MLLYGVTDSHGDALIGDVVEWFETRAEAETFIAECLGDEPGWVAVLGVVAVDFAGPETAQPSLS